MYADRSLQIFARQHLQPLTFYPQASPFREGDGGKGGGLALSPTLFRSFFKKLEEEIDSTV